MKDTLMLAACALSLGLLAAPAVTVPTLPPSEYADTEVSTNGCVAERFVHKFTATFPDDPPETTELEFERKSY